MTRTFPECNGDGRPDVYREALVCPACFGTGLVDRGRSRVALQVVAVVAFAVLFSLAAAGIGRALAAWVRSW